MVFTSEKINEINAARLGKVKPQLAQKVLQLLELAESDGFSLLVTQGFRSIKDQDELYAQGRTKPGKIVTNARGGQSKHNFGTAVDLAFIINGEVSWNENLYRKIGAWARIVGLNWGGNWKSFKDLPHVEL